MARGRMINSKITQDKKINDLSDDTSRLAFTWLITFTDCEGRTHGDPALLRSMLFPRRSDITIEQMEQYIKEWVSAELVNRYDADDDLWIEFPNFEKNQIGLRKDREPQSDIPPPITPNGLEEIQQLSGELPEVVLPKRTEKKRIESRNEIEGKGNEDELKNSSDRLCLVLLKEALELWKELFPDKPQPRPTTKSLQDKWRTRWKDEDFRLKWKRALWNSSESQTLQKESWFNFQFLIKNDSNYQKMVDNWMAWKDEGKLTKPKKSVLEILQER